ncbi:MAG: 5'/3'-nucleotidase SurE [Candidatus Binatia bacterium]
MEEFMQITSRGRSGSAIPLMLAALLGAGEPVAASTLKVVVTNDDGVGAPGIDRLVEELRQNIELEVVVVAPEREQSGTGENRILPPGVIEVRSATTASGYPAKAVAVFPADSVLFGVLQEHADDPPDLIVSGINPGPNMGEHIAMSGTVGAASWGARLGIPAFAVSGSLSSADYAGAAEFAAALVEEFRTNLTFQTKMREAAPPHRGVVLNINWPTCTEGSERRGARVVAVGRLENPEGYVPIAPAPIADAAGLQIWQAQGDLPFVNTLDRLRTSNCNSTLLAPETDVEAWANGFVGIAPLDAERSTSGRTLADFQFLEALF